MTEQIDLDELETPDEQNAEDEGPNRGDWFWKGEGDPNDEPGAPSWREGDADADGTPSDDDADDADDAAAGDANATVPDDAEPDPTPASPHVPSDTAGTPAGIPVSQGGGGAGESSSAGAEAADAEAGETQTRASGPHGGGVDDMTTAFTYRAAKRLANPASAFEEAGQWSDWVGIVGDVEAHVLGSFQRNETIDADFFNGSGTGPAERLAGIGPHSMFYADRMVVVGVEGEDEAIAEEADWEFVPLTDAASGAGWDLVPDESDGDDPTDADGSGDAGGGDADDERSDDER